MIGAIGKDNECAAQGPGNRFTDQIGVAIHCNNRRVAGAVGAERVIGDNATAKCRTRLHNEAVVGNDFDEIVLRLGRARIDDDFGVGGGIDNRPRINIGIKARLGPYFVDIASEDCALTDFITGTTATSVVAASRGFFEFFRDVFAALQGRQQFFKLGGILAFTVTGKLGHAVCGEEERAVPGEFLQLAIGQSNQCLATVYRFDGIAREDGVARLQLAHHAIGTDGDHRAATGCRENSNDFCVLCCFDFISLFGFVVHLFPLRDG